MTKCTTRIWFFDNMKAVLIFFVVLGHVLTSGRVPFLYQFIYLFHMPLFAFCSGYLAKDNPIKIITNVIYPYIIFQILYGVFDRFYMGSGRVLTLTKPIEIMWYMMALTIWLLFLPLISVLISSKKNMIITVCVTLILGIVVGFDEKIGTYLSLSRVFYFLPFFVIGFCVKNAMPAEKFLQAMSKWYVKLSSGVLSLGILIWLYLFHDKITTKWLWGFYSYAEEGYYFTTRMAFYLCTFIISIFIISIMPQQKMFFSYIGRRCLQIYLLHGFIIRILEKNKVIRYDKFSYTFIVGISVLIVFVLSLKIWDQLLKPLFSYPFPIAPPRDEIK